MVSSHLTKPAAAGLLALAAAAWSWAQDPVLEEGPTEPAPAATDTNYPDRLEDDAIALEELRLRLIPLTADQLEALAATWQAHARAATQATVDKALEARAAQVRPRLSSGGRGYPWPTS